MKKNLIFPLVTTLLLIVCFAFNNSLVSYKVNPGLSTLKWKGSKVIGSSHTGNIKLKSGTLLMESDKLKGGNFTIDMTSITNSDIEDKKNRQKLVNHLESDDFFSVKQYPEATFKITSFVDKGDGNYTINGDLTIKDKTEPISFPAIVMHKDSQVVASAKITFDRSKFDVRYGSGSFFDNLGDKAISDEIEMDVALIAKK